MKRKSFGGRSGVSKNMANGCGGKNARCYRNRRSGSERVKRTETVFCGTSGSRA